jgi:hypothetical protein
VKKLDLKKKIEQEAAALAETIRTYARSQKELWQLVPWLALEADTAHNSPRTQSDWAYDHGLWPVGEFDLQGGCFHVCVDLATGELIDPVAFFHDAGKLVPAQDRFVRKLASTSGVGELDAAAIIRGFKKETASGAVRNRERTADEAWRQKIREKHGLKPVFTADQRGPLDGSPEMFD